MDNNQTFKIAVGYFYRNSDVTRYTGWDPDRCRLLMPAFYHAWETMNIYKILAGLAVEEGR